MNSIRVFKEYKEYNLQSVSKVHRLIDKIDFQAGSEIELDLTECLLDYYATSKLIDKSIRALGNGPGSRTLRIVTDFNMGEAPLLNALFLGSEILALKEDRELDIETLRSRIDPKLQELGIIVEVSILRIQGDHVRTIQLGTRAHEDPSR
jgi:hypothetical protein